MTERIRNPLKVYALVEAAIGILALGFHPRAGRRSIGANETVVHAAVG